MSKTACITGCSRGIGLEFVSQLADKGWQVYAITRNPEVAELKALCEKYSNVTPLEFDITQFDKLSELETYFADKPIDLLINNAGTAGENNQIIGNVSSTNMMDVFKLNAVTPTLLCQHLLSALEKGQGKVIANITSRMGSIADNDSGGRYAYRCSKAALNAIMHSMQIDLKDKQIKVLLLHPGWVKTEMGGDQAPVTSAQSVTKMLELIDKGHDLPDSFYHFEGEVLPW